MQILCPDFKVFSEDTGSRLTRNGLKCRRTGRWAPHFSRRLGASMFYVLANREDIFEEGFLSKTV